MATEQNPGERQAVGTVVAVCASATHTMSKPNRDQIELVRGLGIAEDAHLGETVKHRSRIARDPTQPNLRQVHLIHQELFEKLGRQGFSLGPGLLGENVTTREIDLLALPTGSKLCFERGAIVEVTGLRNPCGQLNGIQPGLMDATRERDEAGEIVRIAGIMSIVLQGGVVRSGDAIRAELPLGPHDPLVPV